MWTDNSFADNYNFETQMLEGKGEYFTGGSTYGGIWDDKGMLTCTDGYCHIRENGELTGTYKGAFKDNLPHGKGTFKWVNSREKYVGTFYEGKRHTREGIDGDARQEYLDR